MTRPSAFGGSEEVDRLARLERDDRLLPVLHLAVRAAHATVLAAHDERVDVQDVHVEKLLHRVPDLDLVRLAGDLGLLRERDGALQDVMRLHFEVSFAAAAGLAARFGAAFAGLPAPSDDLPRQRTSSALAASFDSTSVSWRRRS